MLYRFFYSTPPLIPRPPCQQQQEASSTPSGVSSLPTFRYRRYHLSPDLIRHGKHHRQARQDNKHADTEQVSPTSPIRFQQQQRQAQKQQIQQQPAHEHVIASSPPRDVVEIIVNEEREAKLKIPRYPGLENFTLVEKMGE